MVPRTISNCGLAILLGLATTIATSGCAEHTRIRTFPTGATVYVNGQLIGTSPVEYRVPEAQFSRPTTFRIEHPDCEPLEGELRTRVAPGRIFGGIFGLGIPFAFRGVVVFQKNHDFDLQSVQGGTARSLPERPPTENPTDVEAGGRGDAEVKLKQLQSLFDRGLISSDEYRATRSRIIRGL
jgi:hypothetical protein